jgi:Protein of unknown function (DUF1579)
MLFGFQWFRLVVEASFHKEIVMKMARRMFVVCAVALWLAPLARAQEPPKPGPEHERLKQAEGVWEATVKMGDQESKGTMVYQMGLGGLWLTSRFEGDFGGMKFQGRGLETYDPAKKKYISVWADSFSTSPMITEGTYDKESKTVTMTGEGPGPEGKPVKYKSTLEHKDKDTMVFNMYAGDTGDKDKPMLTITYKRSTKALKKSVK